MGFSHSWIAVRGLTPERTLEALGMEVRAVIEPDYFPSGIAMGQWSDDWLIILTVRRASAFEGDLVGLAKFGAAVACEINEHVMYSEARGYDDGAEVWRVSYDCERDGDQLKVTGDVPHQFEAIVNRCRTQQDANDDADYMFEAPALLAKSICGFLLGDPEPDGFRYSELRKIGEPERRPGFLARFFGRG